MALPKSYLTSTRNLAGILDAIKAAQAPKKFTLRFLGSLEFKSTTDRLIVGVLKSLGFLNADGGLTDRYYRYLDQTQSKIVLAEGIREAYSDLFQVNNNAHSLSQNVVVNKFKTLTQGQYSDGVLVNMGRTFVSLCKLADFKSKPAVQPEPEGDEEPKGEEVVQPPALKGKMSLGGLHYNIQIILPESRDPKVYDALFRSLKEHLL